MTPVAPAGRHEYLSGFPWNGAPDERKFELLFSILPAWNAFLNQIDPPTARNAAWARPGS